MTLRFGKGIVIAVVLLHTLLLAVYTFPESFIPERFRVLGQWYARPFFHQRWQLFAPDPPPCSCELEWSHDNLQWRPIITDRMHYLERRIARNYCLWLAEGLHGAERDALPGLRRLLNNPTTANFRVRLIEACISDPALPTRRTIHIVPLYGP
jgi:hypothetical protein